MKSPLLQQVGSINNSISYVEIKEESESVETANSKALAELINPHHSDGTNSGLNTFVVDMFSKKIRPPRQSKKFYYAYLGNESKQSFTRDFILWTINSILLACIILLCLLLILILSIICIQPCAHFTKYYYLFILLLVFMSSLYGISYIYVSATSYNIDAFQSVIPLILSILFREAVIFASGFKYRIELERRTGYPYMTDFTSYCCCCCGNSIIKVIRKSLSIFIKNYQIWGTTLNEYKPFGACHVSTAEKPEQVDFEQLIPTVKERGNMLHFGTLYNKFEKYMKMLSFIWIIFVCFILSTYYIIKYCFESDYGLNTRILNWCIATNGFILLLFVLKSINDYIEIIFYRLCKYYKYMVAMTNLIEIHPNLCHIFAGLDFDQIDWDRNDDESEQQGILLGEGVNCTVWFENWCRIEYLTSTYFNNQRGIVFAIMISFIACIISSVYYYLENDLINNVTIVTICGIIYLLIVVIRLLIYSIKFSSLESRQIHLIKIQQTYIKHLILDPKCIELRGSFMNERMPKNRGNEIKYSDNQMILSYLDDVISHVRIRSLSPKIAGISLDKVVVRLAMSSVFGGVSGLITYWLKEH